MGEKISYVPFYVQVEELLRKACSDDYVKPILELETNNGMTIFDEIKEDVELTSAWEEEAYYSLDDVKLAIGRVLSKHLGL